jgi:DNA-directed RNA polymerase specialized sigma24 family protein
LLNSTWVLDDVDDVEGLIASVVNSFLRRRGAYLPPDLREDLDAYLLGETWQLYKRFDPSKASTPLSLSTFLTRRLNWSVINWYRLTYGDGRYRRAEDERPLVLATTVDTDLEPRYEDAVSQLPSLSDTGRGRWATFGLLYAVGLSYGEIAERTGVATGEIGAELEALRQELRSLS